MKIAIGNDHGGVELKQHIMAYLQKKGHEVVNFGTDTTGKYEKTILNHIKNFGFPKSKEIWSGTKK